MALVVRFVELARHNGSLKARGSLRRRWTAGLRGPQTERLQSDRGGPPGGISTPGFPL